MGLFDKLLKKDKGNDKLVSKWEKNGDSKYELTVSRCQHDDEDFLWGRGFFSQRTVTVSDFEGNTVEFQNVEMTREQLRYAVKDILIEHEFCCDEEELLSDDPLGLDSIDYAEVLMLVEDILGVNELSVSCIDSAVCFEELCDLLARMIFPKKK